MKTILKVLCAVMLGLGAGSVELLAQTDGEAKLEVTLLNYVGTSGTAHWTVVWVATGSGTFIKTLRKQGPSFTDTHWRDHGLVWWNAKGANNTLDGYSSATASNYSGTNSPVILTWNCRDAGNNLMPDGNYRFWVQYAENSGQGPYTTSGLLWTKGPAAATTTYPNQAANFSNMKVTWTPSTPPNTAPMLAVPASQTINELTPYTANATATDADLPAQTLTFALVSGPSGLTVSPSGTIAWTPSEAQGPSASLVEVKVTDSGSPALSVTNSFTLTAAEVNVAPVLTVPADQTINELTLYTANATATDADLPANTLTFALASGPSGLTVSPSGAIAWTPTGAQGPSTNLVEVKVTDNGSPALSVTNSFKLTVNEGAVAPIITSVVVTGGNVVVRGTGTANGTYEVLTSTDLSLPSAQWTLAGTGSFDSSGNFSVTVPMSAGVSQSFTKLRVP